MNAIAIKEAQRLRWIARAGGGQLRALAELSPASDEVLSLRNPYTVVFRCDHIEVELLSAQPLCSAVEPILAWAEAIVGDKAGSQ